MVGREIAGARSFETVQEKAARLMVSDSELAESIHTAAKARHLDSLNLPPIELFQAACRLYGARPALGYRPFLAHNDDEIHYASNFITMSFLDLWAKVVATATGLKRSAFLEGTPVVGICGFAGIDGVVSEFAALYLGVPCVHLDASWPLPELERIVNGAGVTCFVCSAESLWRIAEILPHSPSVQTLLVHGIDRSDTQSSAECTRVKTFICRQNRRLLVANLKVIQDLGQDLTAVPYVVPTADQNALVTQIYEPAPPAPPHVVTYHAADWADFFHSMITEDTAKLPYIALHHLPLSTIEGRGMVIRGLLLGGISYFTAHRDLSTLASEMRLVRPTHRAVNDRIWCLLKERFDRELLSLTVHATVPLPAAERERLVLNTIQTDPMSERLLIATTVDPAMDAATGHFVQQYLSVPVVARWGDSTI